MLFYLQDQEPVADIDGVGDIAARLIPHRLLDFRTQLAFLVSADIAVLLGAGRIGVIVREVFELLALLAAIRQILGFFLGLRGIRSGRRGHQNLPQIHALFALKFVLMAVVILLRFFALDRNLGRDFLANHAVGQQIVLAIVLVIFIGHPGLVPDELLKLVGIGDARFALDVGKLLGYFGVDVEIQLLGFGLEQKLIDALAEDVLVGLRHSLLKTFAGGALLAHGGFHLLAGVVDVAARNDLAVHFGDDLFDDRNLGGGGQARRPQCLRGSTEGA